ncbi:MAG: cysteine dioxygenase family protein [Gaiellales bacterium]
MTAAATWIQARIPPERDLTLGELVEIATAIGEHRDLWQSLVRHDPGQRVYAEFYRDLHLDVWLCCWDAHQDTGYHDHDLSSGAVYVSDGELVEDRLVTAEGRIESQATLRRARSVFDFDAARIHCMRHPGGVPAVSIHCYSPALWRMGYYSFDEHGNFCRSAVTYADEMWERPSGLADALRS